MTPQTIDRARWSGMRLVVGDLGKYSTATASPSFRTAQVPGKASVWPSRVCRTRAGTPRKAAATPITTARIASCRLSGDTTATTVKTATMTSSKPRATRPQSLTRVGPI
jgi:hypothetical protein